jgi:hypothetical protein
MNGEFNDQHRKGGHRLLGIPWPLHSQRSPELLVDQHRPRTSQVCVHAPSSFGPLMLVCHPRGGGRGSPAGRTGAKADAD